MRKNRLYLTIALVLTIAVSLVIGVYSFFTDYQVKTLQAHSGVSLELKKDEGISSVQQSGYIVKKDGAGWYDAGTDATIKAEVKIGYEFDGWYNGNNKISSNADDIYTVNDYTVLTAKSKPIIYKITYDLIGGELPEGKTNPPTYTITSDTITLNNPTKDGYTFKGWIGSNGDTPETTVTIPTGSTGDKHYTAVWEEIEYNITYDLDGGTLPSGKTNPAKYKVTSPDITLNNPERTGYTFLGWTGTELTGSTEPILTSASVNLKYNADNNDCMTTLDSAISLVAGEKYKVTWDNKEYEVECKLHPEMGFPYIGNITLFNDASGTNTGEPFMIVSAKAYNQTMIASGDTANTTHTVAVVAKKFDNPVTIPTGSTGDRHYVAHWRATSAILMEGDGIEGTEGFNRTVPSTATSIVFTDEVAPANATLTDVSLAQDGGVVGWLDGTTYKVSTQRTGVYVKAPTNAEYLFACYGSENLTSIDLSMLDTSDTTNMYHTFEDNYKLQNIIFGDKWDVSNVEDFGYMFHSCQKITSLDLSSWNTPKATYMVGMFSGCNALETITFGTGFDTSNNKDFYQMFNGCKSLKAIDVSGFDTSKSSNFSDMFAYCENIKELDISNFDTSKVSSAVSNYPHIKDMFNGMLRLEKITLGAKFSFNGEGLTEKAVLPTPDATYITDKNVDGKWYNTETNVGYAPADVPSRTAATYTVDAPIANVTYSSNDGGFNVKLAPGLYETGTTTLIKSWDKLVSDGDITVSGTNITEATDFIGDLVISDSITSIGSNTLTRAVPDATKGMLFSESHLTGVTIPDTVTSIGGYAFYNCSDLASVIIGKSVSYISNTAFALSNIKTVYFTGTESQWSSSNVYAGYIPYETIVYNYVPSVNTIAVKYLAGTVTEGEYKEPTRAGYKFAGWYTDKDCTDGNEFDLSKAKGDVTVYAKWEKGYSISYNLDGGTLPDGAVTSYISSEGVTLPTPTKEGYEFVGWSSDFVSVDYNEYWGIDSNGNLYIDGSHYNPNISTNSNISTCAGEVGDSIDANNSISFSLKTDGYISFTIESIGKGIAGGTQLSYSILKDKIVVYTGVCNATVQYDKKIDVNKFLEQGNYEIIFNSVLGKEVFIKDLTIYSDVATSISVGSVGDKTLNAVWRFVTLPTMAISDSWYKGSIDMQAIENITFISFSDFSNFDDDIWAESWDASDYYDGQVMAYRTGLSIYIVDVTNYGKIYANANSSCMFSGLSSLISIDELGLLDTSNVTDMSYMFDNCDELISLNLSGLNTSNVTDMIYMFYNCSNLKTIYVGTGWDTSKADTTDMFTDCGTSSVTYKSSTASLSLDEENDEPVDTTTLYWQSIVDKMFEGATELTLDGEVTEMPLDVIDAVSQLENAVTFTWNDKVFVISQETINDFEYVPGTPISIAELAETYAVKADSTDSIDDNSIEEVDENVENTDSEIVGGSNSDSETEPIESTNEDEPSTGSSETEPIAAESENAVEAAAESSSIDDSSSVGDTDSIAIANTSLLLMMLQYRIL